MISWRSTLPHVLKYQQIFHERINEVLPQSLICIDKVHFTNQKKVAKYKWVHSFGIKDIVLIQQNNDIAFSMILAISFSGIRNVFLKDARNVECINSEDVYAFIYELQESMKASEMLFLNNASIHKTKSILALLNSLEIPHLFNVQYHPQWNGIELMFSYLKNTAIKRFAITTPLNIVIHSAVAEITPELCEKCITQAYNRAFSKSG